ncbi:MAG: hypothetical protein ACRDV3_16625 [Acidothermaceae bacterium]
MSAKKAHPWLSSNVVRFHLPMLIGAPGAFAAGWFELTRALGGREIAWVYAFEWPLYGVAGLYMWWRMWHAELRAQAEKSEPTLALDDAARARNSTPSPEHLSTVDDPGLSAWQEYLKRLEANDPPGGPQTRG